MFKYIVIIMLVLGSAMMVGAEEFVPVIPVEPEVIVIQGPQGSPGQPGAHGRQGVRGNRGLRGPRGPQGPKGESGDYLDSKYGPYRGDPARQKGLLAWWRSVGGITAGEVDRKIAQKMSAEPAKYLPVNPAGRGVHRMDPYVFTLILIILLAVAVAIAMRCSRGDSIVEVIDALTHGANRTAVSERMTIRGTANRFYLTVEPANATPIIPPAPAPAPSIALAPGQVLVPVTITATPVVLTLAPPTPPTP